MAMEDEFGKSAFIAAASGDAQKSFIVHED